GNEDRCHLLSRRWASHIRCKIPSRAPNVERMQDPHLLAEAKAVEEAQKFRLRVVDNRPLVGLLANPDKDARHELKEEVGLAAPGRAGSEEMLRPCFPG